MKIRSEKNAPEPQPWQEYSAKVIGNRFVTYNAHEIRIQDITNKQKALLEQDFSVEALRNTHKKERRIAGGILGGWSVLTCAQVADILPQYINIPLNVALIGGAAFGVFHSVKRSRAFHGQYQLRSDLYAQDDTAKIPNAMVRMHLPMDVLDNEVPFNSEIGEMSLPASLLLQSYVPAEYAQEVGEAFEQRNDDVCFDFGSYPASAVMNVLEEFEPEKQNEFLDKTMPVLTQIGEAFSALADEDAVTKLFIGTLSLQQAIMAQNGAPDGPK